MAFKVHQRETRQGVEYRVTHPRDLQVSLRGDGLPYFNPHSFRRTLAQLGETMCQTPEQFKAWSQNLGHEGVLTTFYSYGNVAERRQGELIKSLAQPQGAPVGQADEVAQAVIRAMRQGGLVFGPG